VSGHQIVLEVLNYKHNTVTFPIDTTSVAAADYYSSSSSYSYATTGQIILTQIVPTIKGTFYFTTADTTAITAGIFTAPTL
jgi:hypothetical protein